MSGEWIAVDCNLATKPEVLELVELTGLPAEIVGWRMVQFWSWASLNTADGRLRASPRAIAAACGGDDAFWRAVETVGWIRFDAGVVEVVGWDRRFSQAAKARALAARRQGLRRDRLRAAADGAPADELPAPPAAARDSKRGTKPAAAARKRAAVEWTVDGGWSGITDADRAEWAAAYPGAVLDTELARATAWLHANPIRAGKRNWKRFIVSWLQRSQERGGTESAAGRRSGPAPRTIVKL